MIRRFAFHSIRSRIVFWFCSLVALVLVVFSIFLYVQSGQVLRARETDKLRAIRDLKVQRLNGFLEKISGDLRILAANRAVQRTGAALCVAGGGHPGELAPIFESYLNTFSHYYELFVVSAATGRVVYSTRGDMIGADRQRYEYVTAALASRDIHISDIYLSPNLKILTMTVSLPLLGAAADAAPAGVLVGRIYLERSLIPLVNDATGLGETGETILVGRGQKSLIPLKGQGRRQREQALTDEPSRLALQGNTGVMESVDYRGRDVVCAYTHIPLSRWGLVVKQDLAEINGPLHGMISQIVVLLAVVLAIVSAIALIIASNLTEPIRSLIGVSRRIQEGDISARNIIDREDELSYLAISFNRMADSIVSEIEFQRTCSDLIEVMLSTIDLGEFSSNLLRKVMEVTGSSIGAFYILSTDGTEFRHLTSIGLDAGAIETFHAERLEGEFGRALATRKITLTRIEPELSLLRLRTIVGDVVPRALLTIPVIVNNRCSAIISLASLQVYDERIVKIMNQIWMVLNAAFSNILAIDERRRLSIELEDKNRLLETKREALQHQAFELKRQSDIMRTQNSELDRQRRVVEEANRLKSEFLSNMSHELRTPLNSILALSRVLGLQSAPKLSEDERSYIEIIERNGRNLLALINDILDLSKIEAGRIDLNPKPISLRTMLGTIMENFEQMAEGKGVALVMDLPAEMPAIESDEARLYQIFQNIIGNAVKFTEAGRVVVTASVGEGDVAVCVTDTGIGIAEKDLPYIFDEFRQIDGTLTRKYEGTGLGLAIASRSASLIAATIAVQSTPGVGSVFTVTLPRHWRSDATMADQRSGGVSAVNAAAAAPPAMAGDRDAGRSRILIVEDDPDNLFTMKTLLGGRYELLEAGDGETGLRLALAEGPDCILLDIALPGMSGIDMVQRLRSHEAGRRVPVIAITALSMTGDRERILAAGCDAYLSKPYDIDELEETITTWVGRHHEDNPGH